MKALTLQEPFATLIRQGKKHIETRGWNVNHRGPLAIHASVHIPTEYKLLCNKEPFASALQGTNFHLGCVIATCNLVACIKIPFTKTFIPDYRRGKYQFVLPPNEPELSFGDYTPGRWAWILEDIRPIEPVPTKGSLGLWEWVR